ncbi:Emsy N Terminus (ENT)/ plant Tudor-like domains-containing protein [Actinidia rufa]|uniref:Emsy N Terminus (ENT)/ plant Tudor-like domains-containing protein n=1 Tax=Actinidia rufa TaxID=165716 RepID=A0A7J0DMX1_9ERIC|nr:Emsy N Terminus (ENT)/ plant Tudor-like domains-containing protein [Actinidia rufa]
MRQENEIGFGLLMDMEILKVTWRCGTWGCWRDRGLEEICEFCSRRRTLHWPQRRGWQQIGNHFVVGGWQEGREIEMCGTLGWCRDRGLWRRFACSVISRECFVVCKGTDDDLPPSHNSRVRNGWVAATGRSIVGSVPFTRNHTDMESEIHQLEQEAYISVLRAFKAQSDALTWEKEGLITELRKELRVSDEEHRELLTKVNADDIIRRIREWRQSSDQHGSMLSTPQPVHDLIVSPTASSRKKQKTSQSVPLSVGVPFRALHSQAVTTTMQPSPSAVKRGPAFGSGGRRPRPGQPLHGLSSTMSMQYPSTGSTGRGQFANRSSSGAVVTNENAEAAARDPLIGRKVMTRWPEDDNFYEAVITHYNPIEGRHALVYDINTVKETWEWVNLKECKELKHVHGMCICLNCEMQDGKLEFKWRGAGAIETAWRKPYMETWDIEGEQGIMCEAGSGAIEAAWCWCKGLVLISPEDVRWVGDDPGISHQGGSGVRHSLSHGVTPSTERERGTTNDQFKKDLPQLQNGVGKVSAEIEILHTETLLKEVEKVFDSSHPNLLEIEKAKKMLKEHEQALIDVIEKLADTSDHESDGEQPISHGQSMNGGLRNMHYGAEIRS